MITSTGAGKKFLKGGASPEARGLPKKEGAGHLTGTMGKPRIIQLSGPKIAEMAQNGNFGCIFTEM